MRLTLDGCNNTYVWGWAGAECAQRGHVALVQVGRRPESSFFFVIMCTCLTATVFFSWFDKQHAHCTLQMSPGLQLFKANCRCSLSV